ncbi:MAG TPA: hypothetical protein VFA63_13650 [Pseudonocardiaceae bacterium]|nr:hypothetical protein [Pseudonocardiaceae bacterium]
MTSGRVEHQLHQPGEQHTRLDQPPHGTGLAYKFPAKLLLINLSRHGLDHLGHNRSLPPSTLGVSGQ